MTISPTATSLRWSARAGLFAALVLSAAASAGCGQRACIEWSQQEGMCPSRQATLTEHIGSCTNITSVDDDGTREGELCCYAVTKSGSLPDCNTDPTTSGPTPPPEPTGCDNNGQCGDFFNFGCRACASGSICGQQLVDCQGSVACSNILNCEAKCSNTDLACQKFCENPNPDGLTLFRVFTSCINCQACPNDCFASASQCSTSPTGTGGAGGMSGTGGAGGMSGTGGAGGKSP